MKKPTKAKHFVYLYGHDLRANVSSSGWAWHLGDGLFGALGQGSWDEVDLKLERFTTAPRREG